MTWDTEDTEDVLDLAKKLDEVTAKYKELYLAVREAFPTIEDDGADGIPLEPLTTLRYAADELRRRREEAIRVRPVLTEAAVLRKELDRLKLLTATAVPVSEIGAYVHRAKLVDALNDREKFFRAEGYIDVAEVLEQLADAAKVGAWPLPEVLPAGAGRVV